MLIGDGILPPPAKRGVRGLVEPHRVAVAPSGRAVPGVERGLHFERPRNPDVGRESAVQHHPQLLCCPMPGNLHAGRLAARVHPRIRPSRAHDPHWMVTQTGERPFHHALHRAFRRLHLPAGEIAAIVLQNELQNASRHRLKASRRRM